MALRILVSQPGIRPVPPAVEVRNPNHWAAREVLQLLLNVVVVAAAALGSSSRRSKGKGKRL